MGITQQAKQFALTSAFAPASSRGVLTRWYLSVGIDEGPCLAMVKSILISFSV